MKNITQMEFIGRDITLVSSRNKSNIGITAKIIDETKNTFVILHKGKRKIIGKKNIIFTTKVNNKTVKINGGKLLKKPEERIKK